MNDCTVPIRPLGIQPHRASNLADQNDALKPGVGLKEMDQEQFPKELTEALRSTVDEYRAVGWQEIEIGWPTTSNQATNTVFLHATSPSGQRMHAVFVDDANLVPNVKAFFQNPI